MGTFLIDLTRPQGRKLFAATINAVLDQFNPAAVQYDGFEKLQARLCCSLSRLSLQAFLAQGVMEECDAISVVAEFMAGGGLDQGVMEECDVISVVAEFMVGGELAQGVMEECDVISVVAEFVVGGGLAQGAMEECDGISVVAEFVVGGELAQGVMEERDVISVVAEFMAGGGLAQGVMEAACADEMDFRKYDPSTWHVHVSILQCGVISMVATEV